MPTRSYEHNIADGDDVAAEPVMDNLNRLKSWFATTAGVGISNSDIATDAAIVGSKLTLASNTAWDSQHKSDGSHTFTGEGAKQLQVYANTTNPNYQVDVSATELTVVNSSGVETLLTSPSIATAAVSSTFQEAGTLVDTAEAISTLYTLVVLHDSTDDAETLVFYNRTLAALDTTFWETDLPAFNTEVVENYDNAKIVGWVYNDSAGHLQTPRPIGGGSLSSGTLPVSPIFTLCAVGTYTGNGVDSRWIDVGFKPDFVMTTAATSRSGVYRTSPHTGDDASFFHQYANAADMIQSFGWNGADNWGFQVGTNVNTNENGVTYYWMALRNHNLNNPA